MLALVLVIAVLGGCTNKATWKDPGYIYKPTGFQAEVQALAPSFSSDNKVVPTVSDQPGVSGNSVYLGRLVWLKQPSDQFSKHPQ